MNKTWELYDRRNIEKKRIEFSKSSIKIPTIGSFRWYYDGINIGSELSKDGKFLRLWIVVSHYVWWDNLIVIMPCTTQYSSKKHHILISINNYDRYNIKPSFVITNQLKHIDMKRLVKKTSDRYLSASFVAKLLDTYYKMLKEKLPIAR